MASDHARQRVVNRRERRRLENQPANDPATRLEARLNPRLELMLVAALLTVMAALRAYYLWEFGGRINESADTFAFVQNARTILDGDVLMRGQPLIFSPLYSYFLALVFLVTGESYLAAVIVQCCLGILGAWLTWRLARDLLGPLAAIFTLALTALYGVALAYEGQALDASFSMLLPPAILLVLHRASGSNKLWGWLGGGALMGLFAWTRPNSLLFVPIAAAWVAFMPGARSDARRYLKAGLVIAGVVLAIMPITLRNWIATGTPTLLTSHGGINFYIGNNPGASGYLTPPPGMAAIPGQLNQEVPRKAAEAATGRTGMTDSEVDRYWFGQGMHFIRSQTGAALNLTLLKTHQFLNATEVETNFDIRFMSEISTAVRVAFVGLGLVLPLGLAGMILSLWQWRRHLLFLGYFVAASASVILFFISARYRLPVVPVLLVYAGFTLQRLLRATQSFGHFAGVGALVGVLALFANENLAPRINPAVEAHMQGFMLEGLGRTDDAVARYDKALRLNPNLLLTHLQLARIEVNRGQLDLADRHYGAALQLGGSDPAVQAEVAQFRASASRQ